jgi:hypothetical protein
MIDANVGENRDGARCAHEAWLAYLREDACAIPFDVAGHAFPAGRGAEQYPWEAPRAIGGDVKVPDRPAKLRALGNAVVPQCGLVVGRILVAMGA